MEFKCGFSKFLLVLPAFHINRITVEFKFGIMSRIEIKIKILIESQWNLNKFGSLLFPSSFGILIESQWNLNGDERRMLSK